MTTINGSPDDDLLAGSPDDDFITGGTGTDTLALAGRSGDARFAIDASGHWVVTSAAGQDTLTGVEQVRFDDGIVALGALESRLNTIATGQHDAPLVAALADGGYVAAWDRQS